MTALFDFDGVLMDTETQYTEFWNGKGREYVNIEDFGLVIKGQTLNQIFGKYFPDFSEEELKALEKSIDEFEASMKYEFIPGAREFLLELKEAGVATAIVTSSNSKKMAKVYKAWPELDKLVDRILVSGDFTKSKPDPECFLKGMELLGAKAEETVVFEDSFHGLAAGRASGAYVVGLATSNSREAIASLCDMVIDDFRSFDLDTFLQCRK